MKFILFLQVLAVHTFLLLDSILHVDHIASCLFINLQVDIWVTYYFETFMNNNAMNIHVQVFLHMYAFISLGVNYWIIWVYMHYFP